MKPMDGIDLAKNLRKVDKNLTIIFLTGFTCHMEKAFGVHAFQYIIKPVSKQDVHKVLDEFYQYNSEKTDQALLFVYNDKGKDIKIKFNKILYFEQMRNTTKIITNKEEINIYSTLKNIKDNLPNYFYQCHRSFVVNISRISKREKESCILDNGFVVPIGRKYFRDFKVEYFDYVSKL